MTPQSRDAADPLAHFRERFVIEPGVVYLDGNSLGRMPTAVKSECVPELLQNWSSRLIRAWGEGWIDLPRRLGDKVASIIGAQPGEVVLADSTSVNFFKLVVSALRVQNGRTKIVTDSTNFPSDLYLLQGCQDLLGQGHQIVAVASSDGIHLPPEAIEAELDENTALLTLTHTAFKSGYVHDLARLTAAAHKVGALVLWDLSHSAGALPVDLGTAHADLAVGCAYKYLNGGPGAPAYLYVRSDLQDKLTSPIWGWFGQKNPFDFDQTYVPAEGIDRFLAGTPSILSLAAIEPGLDLVLEAGIDRLRAKSLQQTDYLIELWQTHLGDLGYKLNSPMDSAVRGSHVSLGHPEALRIDRALIEQRGIIPDFRQPDNIRLGIAPLYTTFSEIEQAIDALKEIVETRSYEAFSLEAPRVT